MEETRREEGREKMLYGKRLEELGTSGWCNNSRKAEEVAIAEEEVMVYSYQRIILGRTNDS